MTEEGIERTIQQPQIAANDLREADLQWRQEEIRTADTSFPPAPCDQDGAVLARGLAVVSINTAGHTCPREEESMSIGFIVLAIWLILTGLSSLVNLRLPSQVLAVVAIVAGLLILLGR
jgi:hypothetical protein